MPDELPDLSKYAIKQSKTSGDETVARVVDDELSKLGWAENARLSFLGDVGRENGWNREVIFGGHSDPKNNSYNRGIISWQGSRREKLDNFLKNEGLLGRRDDNELRGMVRFADKEMRESNEWKNVNQKIRDPNISTFEASENLRKYIKYVPDGQYNSYDSEFRVKNNAEWAKRARKLGLGSLPDLSALNSGGDDGLPDLSQFATQSPNLPNPTNPINPAPVEDVRVETDLQTGLVQPKTDIPTLPTAAQQPPIGQELDINALEAAETPHEKAGIASTLMRDTLQGIRDEGQAKIAPPPMLIDKEAESAEIGKLGKAKVGDTNFKAQPTPLPTDYAEFIKAREIPDSQTARDEYSQLMQAAPESFEPGPQTAQPVRQVLEQNRQTPAGIAPRSNTSPETPAESAKNQIQNPTALAPGTYDNLQRESSGIVPLAKTYKQKPTADEVISDGMTAAYGGNFNAAAMAYRRQTGKDLIILNEMRSLIESDITENYDAKKGLSGDIFEVNREANVAKFVEAFDKNGEQGIKDLLASGEQTKTDVAAAQPAPETPEQIADGQLRAQAEENAIRSPFMGTTDADIEAEYQRLKSLQLPSETEGVLSGVGRNLQNIVGLDPVAGRLAGGVIGGLGRAADNIAGLERFSPQRLLDDYAISPLMSLIGVPYQNSSERSKVFSQIGTGARIISTESAKGAGIAGELANMAGGALVDIPKLIGLSAFPGGAVMAFGLDAGTQAAGRGERIEDVGREAAKGVILGALFSGASKLSKVVEKGAQDALLATGKTAAADVQLATKILGEATKIGTVFNGTFIVEQGFGANVEDAFKSAILNTVFDVVMQGQKAGQIKDLAGKIFRMNKDGKIADVTVDPNGEVKLLKSENVKPEYVDAEFDLSKVKDVELDENGVYRESRDVSAVREREASLPNDTKLLKGTKAQESATIENRVEQRGNQLSGEVAKARNETVIPELPTSVPEASQKTGIQPEAETGEVKEMPKTVEDGAASRRDDVSRTADETETARRTEINQAQKEAFALPFISRDAPGERFSLNKPIEVNYVTPTGREITKTMTTRARQNQLQKKSETLTRLMDCTNGSKMLKNCIKKVGKQLNAVERGELEEAFDAHLKQGMSEYDASSAALAGFHRSIFDAVNRLRVQVGLKQSEYKPFDASLINAKYAAPAKPDEAGAFAPASAESVYENLPEQKPPKPAEPPKPVAKVIYAERPNLAQKINVFTERGTKASIEPKVIDSSDILTSLDEGYPQELQPRDRSRAASKAQISEITNKLNPEFLGDSPKASDGRPLVVPVELNGQTKYAVISGNGRTAGIREAYNLENEGSQKYAEFARGKDATSAKQPVYVGVLDSNEIENLPEFAKEANESATAQMSATEQAKSDAERLGGDVLNLFVPSDDGTIHTAANRDFTRAFLQRAVPTSEQGRLVDADGRLNQDGANRVRNAIFAKAFGDSERGLAAIQRMSESTDNNVKNITGGLLAKAGALASLKQAAKEGTRHKEFNIAPDLATAMEKYAGLKDSGTSVDDYISQGNLFGAETTPFQTRVMQVFDQHRRSPKAIRSIVGNFLDLAEEAGDPNQRNFFGEKDAIDIKSAFEAAVKKYEDTTRSNEPAQDGLFGADSNQG
ncbi:MAG: hypothetical protein M3388_04740, partial [Acidobacteriota bacterium]|nr:hypothetical protein [Acidobacteriota bacterium]